MATVVLIDGHAVPVRVQVTDFPRLEACRLGYSAFDPDVESLVWDVDGEKRQVDLRLSGVTEGPGNTVTFSNGSQGHPATVSVTFVRREIKLVRLGWAAAGPAYYDVPMLTGSLTERLLLGGCPTAGMFRKVMKADGSMPLLFNHIAMWFRPLEMRPIGRDKQVTGRRNGSVNRLTIIRLLHGRTPIEVKSVAV